MCVGGGHVDTERGGPAGMTDGGPRSILRGSCKERSGVRIATDCAKFNASV